MWPFKNKNDTVNLAIPATKVDDMMSMLEMVQTQGVNKAIEDEVKKALSLSDFQPMDGFTDDQGYFGQEFNLRATVGRLKALHGSEPWVYATSSLIARTLSSVPFRIVNVSTNEVNETHPGNDVVMGGNPIQDGIHKRWSGYLDLTLGGNYWEILDENYEYSMHVPVESAEPILRKSETPEQRKELAENGPFEKLEIYDLATGRVSHSVPWDRVIQHKMPNPYNPFYGLSMYVAAARPILLDRHKHEFEMAFYLRGATNAGVIETTEDITKSRMERLMRTFEQAFTGKRNWWRTMFLPKGAKWVNSGLTMKEMEHMEGLRENRLTLLAVLGVPASQVGIVQDVNRATSETQETALWQNTIMPLASFISAGYNNSHLFKNVYKGEVMVVPDYSDIEAVEGSIFLRAERAKAVDDIATVNEQREIVKLEPLPASDPRGNMFASQIKKLDGGTAPATEPKSLRDATGGTVATETGPASDDDKHVHVAEFDSKTGIGKTVATMGADDHSHRVRPVDGNIDLLMIEPTTDDGHTHPNIDRSAEDRKQLVLLSKKNATSNQSRIEKQQTQKYMKPLEANQTAALDTAIRALRNDKNVKPVLDSFADDRLKVYETSALPILNQSMEKGWDLSMSQTRSLSNGLYRIKSTKQSDKISPTDEQALEAIRARDADKRREQLAKRNIESFKGFDEHQTEQIVQIVEDGLKDGKTFEQIASTIKTQFGERYGDQAFTIGRTETLTAVSAGLQANNDALNEVYDKVNKQWFHVGDMGSNPDARVGHANFETVGNDGVVPSDYIWKNEITGASLKFPRDPAGGAGDVINCRCTMVSVIPDDAVSSARTVLED